MISPHVPEILASLMVRGVPHDLPHDFSMSFQLITPLTQNFHRFPPCSPGAQAGKNFSLQSGHGTARASGPGMARAKRCDAVRWGLTTAGLSDAVG